MNSLILVKKRKKPFLLLELLIGISLLTLFAIPLIVEPFYLLQNEMATLERIELERISEAHFAQLKKKIYLQEIPWKELTKKERESPIKREVFITLPGISYHKFETSTYIWSKRDNKEKQAENHLLGIKIIYTPKPLRKHKGAPITFSYRLFVKQVPSTV